MLDCDGGIKIFKDDCCYYEIEVIAGFSFHSKIKVCEVIDVFKSKCNMIYNEEEDECCWICEYTRNHMEELMKYFEDNNCGEDVVKFTKTLLDTKSDVFYVNIC